MKVRPVVLLRAANRDIQVAVARYRAAAGPRVAAGFVAALETAIRHVSKYPESGATRLASEAGIEGVRTWALERYPFIVFYLPRPDRIEVWRVLHSNGDHIRALSPPTGH